jgi:drug/metabolite transporter (DMT)-like permease
MQPEDSPCLRPYPYTAATIATCLMGLIGIFVRHISMSDETIALARFGLGFLFLGCFLLYGGRFHKVICHFSLYPLLSGASIAVCMLFYIKAIKLTVLANAAILLYLGPLLAVVLAFVCLGERLSLVSGLLVLLAFFGCVLILGTDVESSGATFRGNLFAVVAAFFYAFFIVTNRLIPREVSPITRSFYQLLFGAMVLAPFAEIGPQAVVSFCSEISWIVAMGFFQGFLSVTLMIFSLEYLKAYQYGTISYFEPVVASLAGMALYDETITLRQVLGGVIILTTGVAQTVVSAKDDTELRESGGTHG